MTVPTACRRPTRHQLEVLRAYVAAGSIPAASRDLGIAESTARQHLSGLYRRTGYLSAAQAGYLLGRADTAADGMRAERLEAGHRTRSMRARGR